jgi:magnesium transporter
LIRTLVYTREGKLLNDVSIEQLRSMDPEWYWVDFNAPTMEEAVRLEEFGFHRLAIQDCLHHLQRPKLNYFDSYNFFVLHVLHPDTWKPEELDLFYSSSFVVTFHFQEHPEVDMVWKRIQSSPEAQKKGPAWISYKLMDQIVDQYFPVAQELEDRIAALEEKTRRNLNSLRPLMRQVFLIRSQLLTLRHTVWPMRDLLYRILNSERLSLSVDERMHYRNIHDHLEKLAAMIESSREMTADIRDNYLSLNAHRMNSVMMTLTVITTIFMPLTFIVGVYGMNFEYMPELKWKYGYFTVLGIMALIALTMTLWFKKKGWFQRDD